MPASLVNVSSAMSVKLQTGTSGTGKAKYSSFSFSRVNGAKRPDDYLAFVTAITPLISIPIIDVSITNRKRLEA